jgi:23S rRNA G2069 N7-methylase RlmK/C1962 C5-methylase RlmI
VAAHLATGIGAAVLGWRGVVAQGDQRGGVALDWCGDWLVVALGKRNTKSVD